MRASSASRRDMRRLSQVPLLRAVRAAVALGLEGDDEAATAAAAAHQAGRRDMRATRVAQGVNRAFAVVPVAYCSQVDLPQP